MLPPLWLPVAVRLTPALWSTADPCCSAGTLMAIPITKITAMAAKIVQACRMALIALPNMKIEPNGISSSRNSSK